MSHATSTDLCVWDATVVVRVHWTTGNVSRATGKWHLRNVTAASQWGCWCSSC